MTIHIAATRTPLLSCLMKVTNLNNHLLAISRKERALRNEGLERSNACLLTTVKWSRMPQWRTKIQQGIYWSPLKLGQNQMHVVQATSVTRYKWRHSIYKVHITGELIFANNFNSRKRHLYCDEHDLSSKVQGKLNPSNLGILVLQCPSRCSNRLQCQISAVRILWFHNSTSNKLKQNFSYLLGSLKKTALLFITV